MRGNSCEMWDRSTGTRATDSRATVPGGGSSGCGIVLLYVLEGMLMSLCGFQAFLLSWYCGAFQESP